MARQKFIELQTSVIDLKFALTVGEENSRVRFRQLAIETYDFLVSMDANFVQAFDPRAGIGWQPSAQPMVGQAG